MKTTAAVISLKRFVALGCVVAAMQGCIKKTPDAQAETTSVAGEAKPIVTILEQNVSTEMMDNAAKQFFCQDDASKKQFIESGIKIGWDEAERAYHVLAANDLNVWLSKTRDAMLQAGTHAAGESLPTSTDPANESLPSNRCLMLGRASAYAWFFYSVLAQAKADRCDKIPTERLGAYTALLFYRLQSLQKVDDHYATFALPLSDTLLIAPACPDVNFKTCTNAFTKRLNESDSEILKAKDPVSKPLQFAEVYCR